MSTDKQKKLRKILLELRISLKPIGEEVYYWEDVKKDVKFPTKKMGLSQAYSAEKTYGLFELFTNYFDDDGDNIMRGVGLYDEGDMNFYLGGAISLLHVLKMSLENIAEVNHTSRVAYDNISNAIDKIDKILNEK